MKKIAIVLLMAVGSANAQVQESAIYAFDMRAVTVGPSSIDTLDVKMLMGFRGDSVCFNIDRSFCLKMKFTERSPGSTLILCDNEFGEPAGVRLLQTSDKFLVWIMQSPPSVSYFLTSKD